MFKTNGICSNMLKEGNFHFMISRELYAKDYFLLV